MNKKGFIELDQDQIIPIGLAILGGMVAIFTASGGFSYMISGEQFNPGIFTKIAATVGGAIAGYIWAFYATK